MIQPATLIAREAAGGQMKTPPTLNAEFWSHCYSCLYHEAVEGIW